MVTAGWGIRQKTAAEEVHQKTVVEGLVSKHKMQKDLLGIEVVEQTAVEMGLQVPRSN